jgi:periplasmic protein TonB
MNWPRLIGLLLALCMHGGVLYAVMARPASNAFADASGSDDFNVVAEVRLESDDFLTQRAQEAEIDRAPAHAAPSAVPLKQEPELKPADETQTEGPPLQRTADATLEPAELPPEAPRPDAQPKQNMTETATVAAKAQDAQQAAAVLAARRNQLWSQYSVELNLAFDRHKVHVAEKGDVLLEVTVAPSGQLLEHAVLQSSGIPRLDRAAITALERAAPFPPLPPELSSSPLTFSVPFRFRTR